LGHAAIFCGFRIIDEDAPRKLTTPSSAVASRRARNKTRPALVIEAMNGTGSSPAVRIKGHPV
jgi:hypothetical protein